MNAPRQAVRLLMAVSIFAVGLMLVPRVSADSGTTGMFSQAQGETGIDLSDLIDTDALGFLSPEQVRPWGQLYADETERLLIASGDTVYVSFDKGRFVKPGDLFTVFDSSSELEHPLSGKDVGYVISSLGRVVLKQEVKPNLFKAQIVECYHPMQVGNPVIPFEPVSPCLRLTSPERTASGDIKSAKITVVAARGLRQVIGQRSVVYMNDGQRQGIRRGNIFQILVRPQTDQPKEPGLPDQVLGYLIILEARPATSTGIVITAKSEFYSGATLKAVDLEQALRKALSHFDMKYDDADIENRPIEVLDRLLQKTGPHAEVPAAFILLSKMPRCRIEWTTESRTGMTLDPSTSF